MPAITPTSTELALRDIHLPDSVSWWPLAPGWWILLGVALFLVVSFYLIRKLYRSKALHRDANSELEKIKQQFIQTRNQYELIQALSTLIRRCCISFYPREESAGLTGEKWLKYLDATSPTVSSNTETFFNGVGNILASAPYMNEASTPKFESDDLIVLCESWLHAQPVKQHLSVKR